MSVIVCYYQQDCVFGTISIEFYKHRQFISDLLRLNSYFLKTHKPLLGSHTIYLRLSFAYPRFNEPNYINILTSATRSLFDTWLVLSFSHFLLLFTSISIHAFGRSERVTRSAVQVQATSLCVVVAVYLFLFLNTHGHDEAGARNSGPTRGRSEEEQ